MVKHHEIDPSEGDERLDIPERALWLAVIEQQVSDATFGFSRKVDKDHEVWVHYRRPAMSHVMLHEDAMRWVFLTNDTFIPICHLAAVDPESIRDRVKKLLSQLEKVVGVIPSRQTMKKKKNEKS